MRRRLVALLAIVVSINAAASAADFEAGKAAYETGDYESALREWRPLAEQGSAAAQFNLGLLYEHGQGVPADRTQAASWYLKSAEQGFARAQYRIAELFEAGEGVEQDPIRALMWFTLAGKQRYEDARKRRKRLARTMTPLDISFAELYVREWLRERKRGAEGS